MAHKWVYRRQSQEKPVLTKTDSDTLVRSKN